MLHRTAMRIAIDARCVNAEHITGIERMVIRILEHWPDNGPECIAYVDRPVKWSFPNCTVRVLTPRQPALWFNMSLPIALRRDCVDVFVSPVTQLPPFLPSHITKIVVVYDLGYLAYPQFYNANELHILNGKVRKSIVRSDSIIADSQFTADDVATRLNIPSSRIRTVHLAMDPPIADPVLPEGVDTARPYILTVGTAYGRKNLGIIIPVLKSLREKYSIDIDVIMTGKKGFAEQSILEQAHTNGLDSRIHHLGYVHDSEKAALLRHAAVFFFPSLYEGFGIPVLEAMQYGCPVVCANASSLPEVAGDAALMFDPKSPDDAAEALHQILNNPTIRAQCIERGHKNIKRFSWDNTARRFVVAIR